MATKARALIQTMWRNGDGIDKYLMIGGALGAVTSVGTGVVVVLQDNRADDAVVAGLTVGGLTSVFWPAGVAGAALYVPLKGLELLRRRNESHVD